MKQFQKETCVIYKKRNDWCRLSGMGMILLWCVLLLSGCEAQPTKVQKTDTAMGTIVSQTLYLLTEEAGDEITAEVMECIRSLEEETLSWRLESAEVYRINARPEDKQKIQVSDFLGEVLKRCKGVYEASGGAFDFSLGSLTRLWNMDQWAADADNFVLPAKSEITAALSLTGADKFQMNDNAVELSAGMQLDLGAVGKGIALDEIKKLLVQKENLSGGVISVGGSILTLGSKPDGGKWNVGIVNPMDTSQYIGMLQLPGDFCVSTSGDYERCVEAGGVRFHHILDPVTGYPADSGVHSVTILTQSGLESDALSTACFVLGAEEGMELADSFGAEALFVLENGEILMTEGMKEYFCLSNGGK